MTTLPRPNASRNPVGLLALLVAVGAALPARPAVAAIRLVTSTPNRGQRVSGQVQLIIQSTTPLVSTSAKLGGQEVPLERTSNGQSYSIWKGQAPAAALTWGEKALEIEARNEGGETLLSSYRVFVNATPRISVLSPRLPHVSDGWVEVEATCMDDDPGGCSSLALSDAREQQLATGKDRVSARVFLGDDDGKTARLHLIAKDAAGDEGRSLVIPVERSGRLRRIDRLPPLATLLDVDGGYTLYRVDREVRFFDRARNEARVVSPPGELCGGRLLPSDAVWLECNESVLRIRADGSRASHLGFASVIKGDAAAWLVDGGAYVAGLGAAELVPRHFVGPTHDNNHADLIDVSEQGFVAYLEPKGDRRFDLYRDDGHGRRLIKDHIPGPSSLAGGVVADGPHVAWMQVTEVGTDLWLFTEGKGVVRLGQSLELDKDGDNNRTEDRRRRLVDVRGGWVAWVRAPDILGPSELFVRAPGGAETRVRGSAGGLWILGLAPNGDLLFADTESDRRYLSAGGAEPQDVGGAFMRDADTFWAHGWFVHLAGTVFEVTGTSPEGSVIAAPPPVEPPPDASGSDAGAPDASRSDAGAPDASGSDAGAPPDARAMPVKRPAESTPAAHDASAPVAAKGQGGGCSLAAASAASPLAAGLAGLLAALLARAARRQRRRAALLTKDP